MAFVPVPNGVLAFMEYLFPNGNRGGNAYWFRNDAETMSLARLETLRSVLETWEGTAKAVRSNQISLVRINIRDMSEESGWVLDHTVSPPIVGTVVSPVLPANVTIAVSHRTGLAGRSFRGRTYWIGLSEGTVAGDFLTSGAGASIVTRMTNLRTMTLAEQFTFCICSRQNGGVPRSTGVLTPVTNSFMIDERVDTQRRRLIGEGI